MARLLYPDIGKCQALVIDGNSTSRSILSGMLRDMGVGQVAQATRAADARRLLEGRAFDLVLCDSHFDHTPTTGQDLLDELRRAQLLPYSTVFVMVTGEASYASVAEAAESALDGYLVKPHTAAALEQRVLQARQRKKVLGAIFQAIAEADLVRAAALCQSRFEQRGEYRLYAARIGAELWLRIGQPDRARSLYEAVLAADELPWARLGVGRAELEAGHPPQARHTLAALLGTQPAYADAHDVLGRVQLELGELDAALDSYRAAARLTPASIVRLQRQGMLAFRLGLTDEAVDTLERCVRIGIGSKLFDGQSLLLLALLHHDRRDAKGFAQVVGHLRRLADRDPDDTRLGRLLDATRVLQALLERRPDAVLPAAAALAAQLRDEGFDFEAAGNLLAVLSRAGREAVALPEADTWIATLARRFCASKAATDLLCLAARLHPPHEALLRQGQQEIAGLTEKAMTHSLNGAHETAVRSLLALGRETLNAKLFDMAGLVLNRHAQQIDAGNELGREIAELRRRFGRASQLALGGSGGRAAGGLTLRA